MKNIEERYKNLLEVDGTHPKDNERKALLYILSANEDLYNKVEHIYNFNEHVITPKCLESEDVDFSSSSRKLIKLAYNLYNSTNKADVMDTLYILDNDNFEIAINAIKIRFDKL